VSSAVLAGERRVAPAAAAGYALLAFLFLGVPLLADPGSRYVGHGLDPQIFIWSFAWWPHAILHGENPVVTHAVWAPAGVNLAWVTAVPGLALAFAPLTLVAGAVVSYDTAAILMPAFAAWTAFLLCRRLTGTVWPSLAGGYLFGFSSYVLGQDGGGHMNLSSAFLLPLIALVTVRAVEGELAGRRLAVRMGPLLAFQLLLSTEVAFTVTLALAVGLLLCVLLVPDRRRRLWTLLPGIAGSYLLAGLLTSPFLYYLLTGVHAGGPSERDEFVADLVNFAVPTRIVLAGGAWLTGISDRFPTNFSEQGAYLGLPALVIVGLFARERLRSPGGRFLLAALAAAVVAALGAHGAVAGHRIATLPWAFVHDLPLFDQVLAIRLTVFAALAAAVIVASWAAGRRSGLARVLLPALAALAIVPDPGAGVWSTAYTVPRFFTDAAYRGCLAPGEIVLPIPISQGNEMLWQVESGFRLRMAGGYVGPATPSSFMNPGSFAYITTGNRLGADRVDELRSFIAAMRVTSVVVDPGQAGLVSGALDPIAHGRRVGGVILYHIAGPAPPCPGPG
jgi:hypothetical protein